MTRARSQPEPLIHIVAAVITDPRGCVLLVRKRGTVNFMFPGGKLADAEDAIAALTRELREELGCGLASAPVELGAFTAPAANEPGHRVDARVFTAEIAGEPRACSEIAEIAWHDGEIAAPYPLAPLARDHVLPLIRVRRNAA